MVAIRRIFLRFPCSHAISPDTPFIFPSISRTDSYIAPALASTVSWALAWRAFVSASADSLHILLEEFPLAFPNELK